VNTPGDHQDFRSSNDFDQFRSADAQIMAECPIGIIQVPQLVALRRLAGPASSLLCAKAVPRTERAVTSAVSVARLILADMVSCPFLNANGVSFLSVTQQFNTTTSMGGLTLNVLLTFAQFEREVTSERIRDKIGASKRKGLWVGGMVPLGCVSRTRSFCSDTRAKLVTAITRGRHWLSEIEASAATIDDIAAREAAIAMST
jgi:resolvase-like protein